MSETATKNWYIVHTYSGFENKVKESLEERVKAYGLQDKVGEILIPTEDVVEMRAGKKVVVKGTLDEKTKTIDVASIEPAPTK